MSKNTIEINSNNSYIFVRLKQLASEISKFHPIAIQFITIDKPGGNNLLRYLVALDENCKTKYLNAERKFTGVTEDNEQPVRTLVFSRPEGKIFGYKTLRLRPIIRNKISFFPHSENWMIRPDNIGHINDLKNLDNLIPPISKNTKKNEPQ